MHNTIDDVRSYFINELFCRNFTEDRTGGKTIELLGASFLASENAIFGKPNQDYIDAEIDWYNSQSTNINDIYGTGFDDKKPPQAWRMTANQHGEINSNYGHLIEADKYFNQWDRALTELLTNPDSRRAFICTNSVTYYIRDDKVHCVVQMRSNDVIFGYRNDYAWQLHVLQHMAEDLGYEVGDIHWQVQNLHVYERHFDLVL